MLLTILTPFLFSHAHVYSLLFSSLPLPTGSRQGYHFAAEALDEVRAMCSSISRSTALRHGKFSHSCGKTLVVGAKDTDCTSHASHVAEEGSVCPRRRP